jgi:predicted transcriptional regulator
MGNLNVTGETKKRLSEMAEHHDRTMSRHLQRLINNEYEKFKEMKNERKNS